MYNIICKIVAIFIRISCKCINKKGTDLPGKILRKIDKNVLKKLSKNFDEIIFITGTNGKTTTSNLIGYSLKKIGKKIVNNYEGANMLDGIITSIAIQNTSKTKIAILEVDEGSIKKIMNFIIPTKIVFNNFFRDQIDRFGEIDVLISTISEQIKNKDIQLILNTDDPFVMRLDKYGKNNKYFGLEENLYNFNDTGITESKFCPVCSNKLNYKFIHYSQLGIYNCLECGFKRKNPNYSVSKIDLNPEINILINKTKFHTKMLGVFNVYNILAAYSLLKQLELSDNEIEIGFSSYVSLNGRMEIFEDKNNLKYIINLAKNPAGMNVSLSIANNVKNDLSISYLLILNDNYADGLDISWIWDADFEILKNQNIKNIICSGKRAKELALRLKYTDIKVKIYVEEDIKSAIYLLKNNNSNLNIIIPNYTALIKTKKEVERELK